MYSSKAPSERILELAKPRKRYDQPIIYQYTCGQPDSTTKPTKNAKFRPMSSRLEELSKPIVREAWNNEQIVNKKKPQPISDERLSQLSRLVFDKMLGVKC